MRTPVVDELVDNNDCLEALVVGRTSNCARHLGCVGPCGICSVMMKFKSSYGSSSPENLVEFRREPCMTHGPLLLLE